MSKSKLSFAEMMLLSDIEFTNKIVLPIAARVAFDLPDRDEIRNQFVYNARTDEAPELLRHVNAELLKLGDEIPNRHPVFDANVCINGSLRSGGAQDVVKTGRNGGKRARLVAMLTGFVETRPDIARILRARYQLTDRQTIESADDPVLVECYKMLNRGALNLEDHGFYRATTDNEFAANDNAKYRSAISKTGVGEYTIKFTKLESAIAEIETATHKRIVKRATETEKKKKAVAKSRAAKKRAKKQNAKDK
jgi:hypothetical protein